VYHPLMKEKHKPNWATTIGWSVQRWVNANNIHPKGSPCHVLDSDEMVVKSPCLKAFEKYNGNGHA
jgi:hypothetical protein